VQRWSQIKPVLDAEMARRMGLGRGNASIGLRAETVRPWVVHDLRRTMASGLARMGTPIHITERILNHVSGSFGGLVSVYQRYTYKSEVLEALTKWCREVERIISASAKHSLGTASHK
jgi:hypothetical protein